MNQQTYPQNPVVDAALRGKDGPAVAIQLNDGRIVTGKTTFGASAAALNALKELGGIQHDMHLFHL